MITPLYANAPLTLPPWQVAAITAQAIRVRYPDDMTPVRTNATAYVQNRDYD